MSLDALPECPTLQEMFSFSVRALRKQGRKSKIYFLPEEKELDTTYKSAYRGDNGDKCALGHLMTDQEYDPEFDSAVGGSLRVIKYKHSFSESLKAKFLPYEEALLELQVIHDQEKESMWEARWARYAQKWNLKLPPLET